MSAAERIAKEIQGLPEAVVIGILETALKEHTKTKTSVETLRFYRDMSKSMEEGKSTVSAAIISSVGMIAGAYNGFTVVDCSGRVSVDTPTLHEKFPDAYDAVVKWGKPYQTVRLHNN